jgi:uncharacterized membrane protein
MARAALSTLAGAMITIARVRRGLDKAVDRIFPEKKGTAVDPAHGPIKRDYDIPTTCDREVCQVRAARSGYLQSVETEALAAKINLIFILGAKRTPEQDAALDMIRQNAYAVPAVSIRLLETMATVLAQTHRQKDRNALLRQAAMVAHGCKLNLPSEDNREDLDHRYQAAIGAPAESQTP